MFKHRINSIGKAIVLLFLLTGCPAPEPGFELTGKLIPIDSVRIPEKDPEVDSVIGIYREALEETMNRVVAHSARYMQKASPEGLLNNFVADLVYETGRQIYEPADGKPIDFCLLNYGGLRTTIPQGPVTLSRVFELMPFDNEMVVITLSPEKTREALDYLAAASRGMPISGLRIVIEDERIKEASIGGEPFAGDRNYKVLTSDYLAGGGDNMVFFLNPIDSEPLDMKIRDAIIEYMELIHRRGEMIRSELDGRIRME